MILPTLSLDESAYTTEIVYCQSQFNFETCIDNFELNLETLSRKNPFLLVAIGDFNAKSKFWYCNDNTTSQRKALENVTSQFGLHQANTYFKKFFFEY